MEVNIYGIKNCDTMKKAFSFLEGKGIAYNFIDYKKHKPDERLLVRFAEKVGFESLINKKGTTYRKLKDEDKQGLEVEATALVILGEHSSMIKRPIIEFPDGTLIIGFDEEKIISKLK